MNKDYRSYSFWLESVDDDLTPRAPLDGSTDVDVAILGAGFTGLWTAYYLLKRDPSLRVAVVEKEIAGFGASGRNGGFLSSGFPVTMGMLDERYGPSVARDTYYAMRDSVDEVLRVLEEEGIDAHQQKSGSLRMARGPHQLSAIDGAYRTYQRLGLGDEVTLLDASEIAERVRVTKALKGIFNPSTAVVHPGRLVRGLARAVERAGGVIYEQTAVLDYEAGEAPRLMTDRGDVRAKTIVLAGEAYLSQLPQMRRSVIPVYSLITMTEPLSDAQWEEIGWQGRECIGSSRFSVDYLSKTVDGRIVFGGRGAPYHFGSKIDDSYDRHTETHEMLKSMALDWFPVLKDSQFSHSWGGPLGMPRDWMPTMSYDPIRNVATARGYTGQGVATANLSGRVLTDLITFADSDLVHLPTVNHSSPDWEPEPLRWLGVRLVQSGFAELDAKAEKSGMAPSGRSLAERLGRH